MSSLGGCLRRTCSRHARLWGFRQARSAEGYDAARAGRRVPPGVPEILIVGRERAFLDWFYQGPSGATREAISTESVNEYVRTFPARRAYQERVPGAEEIPKSPWRWEKFLMDVDFTPFEIEMKSAQRSR